MELREFIATTISEYLNENQNYNNLDLSDYNSTYNFAMEHGSEMFWNDEGEFDENATDQNGYTLKELINTYMGYYSEINDEAYIKLYRTIQKDKLSLIDYNNLGIYYSKREGGAFAYGTNLNRPEGKNYYTFTIEVEPKYIDWKEGFISFMSFGVIEDEIRLVKNAPIEIIDIEYNGKHKTVSIFVKT